MVGWTGVYILSFRPEIGATEAETRRTLQRMRERPNFAGYLRDSMYWAHLSAQLIEGIILSARELDASLAAELALTPSFRRTKAR